MVCLHFKEIFEISDQKNFITSISVFWMRRSLLSFVSNVSLICVCRCRGKKYLMNKYLQFYNLLSKFLTAVFTIQFFLGMLYPDNLFIKAAVQNCLLISHQPCLQMITLLSDGFVYERAAIEEWLLSRRQTSPMTNLPVSSTEIVPQELLRQEIQVFLAKSR